MGKRNNSDEYSPEDVKTFSLGDHSLTSSFSNGSSMNNPIMGEMLQQSNRDIDLNAGHVRGNMFRGLKDKIKNLRK